LVTLFLFFTGGLIGWKVKKINKKNEGRCKPFFPSSGVKPVCYKKHVHYTNVKGQTTNVKQSAEPATAHKGMVTSEVSGKGANK
jgi:hypothetical protein